MPKSNRRFHTSSSVGLSAALLKLAAWLALTLTLTLTHTFTLTGSPSHSLAHTHPHPHTLTPSPLYSNSHQLPLTIILHGFLFLGDMVTVHSNLTHFCGKLLSLNASHTALLSLPQL